LHKERSKIKPLTQKTKDRLIVLAALAMEVYFVYGSINGLYNYIYLNKTIELYLGIFSIILAAILLVFLIMILVSYLDKRRVLNSFKK